MVHLRILLLTSVVAIGASCASVVAVAGPAQDAAFDKRGSFVQDSWGHCVRTKWDGDNDPCAPAPAPVAEPAPTPPPPPPPPPAPVVELEQRTVYFDFDSDKLDMEAIGKLDHLVSVINASSAITDVKIIGYTDQFGSDSYNLHLSEKRVHAVETYLNGRSRLASVPGDIRGLGKANAESDCQAVSNRADRIACMRKERRVEVEFKYEH